MKIYNGIIGSPGISIGKVFLYNEEKLIIPKYNISKKHINKIFELMENDDDEAIQRLINEEKAERYNSGDFRDEFINDLKSDFKTLQQIKIFRYIRKNKY